MGMMIGFIRVPLLKGGDFGPIVTAPLVLAAAKVKAMIKNKGGAVGDDWMRSPDSILGSSTKSLLEDIRKKHENMLPDR